MVLTQDVGCSVFEIFLDRLNPMFFQPTPIRRFYDRPSHFQEVVRRAACLAHHGVWRLITAEKARSSHRDHPTQGVALWQGQRGQRLPQRCGSHRCDVCQGARDVPLQGVHS